MAPRIAVLAGFQPAERLSLHRGYIDALWEAGAVPVVLGPARGQAQLGRYLAEVLACDGICISGGGDVDPACYGASRQSALEEVDTDRDVSELAAVTEAFRLGRPLLGICRGIQVLAVAAGGSLVQDLPSAGFYGHWQEDRQYDAVHDVEAEPGSLAGRLLAGASRVNSIHHQAVAFPGRDLVATAWSPDGVIEAIEGPGVLGVQWHPERLFGSAAHHLAPFRWLTGV